MLQGHLERCQGRRTSVRWADGPLVRSGRGADETTGRPGPEERHREGHEPAGQVGACGRVVVDHQPHGRHGGPHQSRSASHGVDQQPRPRSASQHPQRGQQRERHDEAEGGRIPRPRPRTAQASAGTRARCCRPRTRARHLLRAGTEKPLAESRTQRGTAPQRGIVASTDDLAHYLQMMMDGHDEVLSAEGTFLMMWPASCSSPTSVSRHRHRSDGCPVGRVQARGGLHRQNGSCLASGSHSGDRAQA